MRTPTRLGILLTLLLASTLALCTTLTGTIKVAGKRLNGKLVMAPSGTLVDTSTSPASTVLPGEYTFSVTNGVLPASANVPGLDTSVPNNITYTAKYYDAYGKLLSTSYCAVGGNTFDMSVCSSSSAGAVTSGAGVNFATYTDNVFTGYNTFTRGIAVGTDCPTGLAGIVAKTFGGVRHVECYPGADFGAKLAAAVDDSVTGSIIDARGVASPLVVSDVRAVNKTVVVLFPSTPISIVDNAALDVTASWVTFIGERMTNFQLGTGARFGPHGNSSLGGAVYGFTARDLTVSKATGKEPAQLLNLGYAREVELVRVHLNNSTGNCIQLGPDTWTVHIEASYITGCQIGIMVGGASLDTGVSKQVNAIKIDGGTLINSNTVAGIYIDGGTSVEKTEGVTDVNVSGGVHCERNAVCVKLARGLINGTSLNFGYIEAGAGQIVLLAKGNGTDPLFAPGITWQGGGHLWMEDTTPIQLDAAQQPVVTTAGLSATRTNDGVHGGAITVTGFVGVPPYHVGQKVSLTGCTLAPGNPAVGDNLFNTGGDFLYVFVDATTPSSISYHAGNAAADAIGVQGCTMQNLHDVIQFSGDGQSFYSAPGIPSLLASGIGVIGQVNGFSSTNIYTLKIVSNYITAMNGANLASTIINGSDPTLNTMTVGPAQNALTATQADFETNSTTGWVGYDGNCALAADNTTAKHGSYSMAMSAIANGAGFSCGLHADYKAPVVGGKTYYGSAWVKAKTAGRSFSLGLGVFDASGTSLGIIGWSPIITDTTTGYTQLMASGVTPANAAYATIAIYVTSAVTAGEIHNLDQASISTSADWQIPDPTKLQTFIDANGNVSALTVKQNGKLVASQLQVQQQAMNYAADTGAADAYAVTLAPAPTLVAGMPVVFKAAHANTGASTLAVNGGTAKAIVRPSGAALSANDIVANQIVRTVYDGTSFQLPSIPPATTASTPHMVWGTYVAATTTSNGTYNMWTPSAAITLEKLNLQLSVAPVGCTTFPIVCVQNYSTSTDGLCVTLAAGAYTYVGSTSPVSAATNATVDLHIQTTGVGCSTNAVVSFYNASYTMQ